MSWTPATNYPILTRRIPCWPHGDPATRRTWWIDDYMKKPADAGLDTRAGTLAGYESLRKTVTTMTPDEVVEHVKKAVLRGRGGAGFPAGMKWSFLPKPDANGEGGQRYLAINADESEPASFKDRLLIDFDPHLVIEGIIIACYACRIQTAYFYIRGEYHHQAKVMEKAIQEAYAKGILGKSGILSGVNTKNRDKPWGVDLHLHRGAARTSAAKRPRCSSRSRASAAGRATSRRSLPSRASSAARRSSTTSRRSPMCRASWRTAGSGSASKAATPPSPALRVRGAPR
ncbi:MAG: hypothetical protein QM783_01610 [Phycisphaerales bacterium]